MRRGGAGGGRNVPVEELLQHEDSQVRELAQQFLHDPRVAAQVRAEGLPPEVVQLMHSGVTADQVGQAVGDLHERRGGGGGGGGDRAAPRMRPPAYAPWRLEPLRKQFGSSKLEELGSRVNEPNENRRLLALAEANGDVDVAVAMLESEGEARAAEIGAGRLKDPRPAGAAPAELCCAVVGGNVEAARRCLARPEAQSDGHAHSLFMTEEESVTADADWDLLRVSAVQGPTEMCALLVEAGAELDRPQAHTGRTPLYNAAWAGQLETTQWLHEQGADLYTTDVGGSTACWAAASEGHAAVVAFLVENGADAPNETRQGALKLVNLALKKLRESPDNEKVRSLRSGNKLVRKITSAGYEALLTEAGFVRDVAAERFTVEEPCDEQIARVQAKVAALLGRMAGPSGPVSDAPIGARVVRGTDWKWAEQDGGQGGAGTVVSAPDKDKGWATVSWDRTGRTNAYRTGADRGCYDLDYAPDEPHESPFDAAKRLKHGNVLEIFSAARWWQETSMATIMQTKDGTLPAKHLNAECSKCHCKPIVGARYTGNHLPASPRGKPPKAASGAAAAGGDSGGGSGGGGAQVDLCSNCVGLLTRTQRRAYTCKLHPALGVFADELKFCRRHALYDLADYLEFTDQKASVRAKQRLACAQGLADDDSAFAWLEYHVAERVVEWLNKFPEPRDDFVLRALEEDAGGSRAQKLVGLSMQMRPEFHVFACWLRENHLPDTLLQSVRRRMGRAQVGQSIADLPDELSDDEESEPEPEPEPAEDEDEDSEDDGDGELASTLSGSEEVHRREFAVAFPRAHREFNRRIIEYRRIRQIVTPERTHACHPRFNQHGQLAEQQKVMEQQIPRLLSESFDVGGAIVVRKRHPRSALSPPLSCYLPI